MRGSAMKKLLSFKNYLTLDEASSYLSSLSNEKIEKKDLYSFALEGRLVLSVYHINQCTGYLGSSTNLEKAKIRLTGFNLKDDIVKNEAINSNDKLRDQLHSLLDRNETRLASLDIDDSLEKMFEKAGICLNEVKTLYIQVEGRLLADQKTVVEFNDYNMQPTDHAVGLWNLELFGAGENYIRYQLRKSIDGEEIIPNIDMNGILLTNSNKTQWFLPCTYSGRCSITAEQYAFANVDYNSCYKPSLWFNSDSVIVVSRAELDKFVSSFNDDNKQPITEREKTTYLNIIGSMLEVLIDSGYDQKGVIERLVDNHNSAPGISKTTLENKFSEAKKTLNG
jgi:hypothetical protein